MRKVILLASLVAVTGPFASAGMPFFHNSDASAGAVPTHSSAPSRWRMPRLWGKKDVAPDPQFFYQGQTTLPTAQERIADAFTNNAAVNTARTWMTPDPSVAAPQRQPDPIALSQPLGKPTPELIVSMAQIQEKQGNIEGARQTYQSALAANPNRVETLREMGHFEDRQNQLTNAEQIYNQAAKLAPNDAAVLNDLALCLARQGKTAPSAQVLGQAIRLAPKKALYRNNMATVLMELGEQHEAMQHLLAAHPPAAAYYNMGHLLEKGDQTVAAAAHYAEALRLDPAMTPAQTALARVAPATRQEVPQTAMAPAAAEPTMAPRQAWPSQPVAPQQPAAAPPSVNEPAFGPRLLPPVD